MICRPVCWRTIGVVFDEQDRLGRRSAVRGTVRQVFPSAPRGGHRARQIEPDDCAVADLGVDRRVAAGLLDEAVDHAEAKPGALADVLGGEERLERARQPPPAACRCRSSVTAIIT